MSFSSQSKSPTTVSDVVKYLEIQCNGTGDSETCEKYYSKMMSDCSGDSVCEGNVTLGKEKFCERPGRRDERICKNRKIRINGTMNQNPNGNQGGKPIPAPPPGLPPTRPPTTTSTPAPPPTPPPTPPPRPTPPPTPLQPQPASAPAPPAPAPASESSFIPKIALLLGAGFLVFLFIGAGVSLLGFWYYRKEEEKKKKKLAAAAQQAKNDKKKKKTKKGGKKERSVMKKVEGEGTRIERQEARKKDREDENERWRMFAEANKRQNSFLMA